MKYFNNNVHFRVSRTLLLLKALLAVVLSFSGAFYLGQAVPTADTLLLTVALVAGVVLFILFGLGTLWMLVSLVHNSRRLRRLSKRLQQWEQTDRHGRPGLHHR